MKATNTPITRQPALDAFLHEFDRRLNDPDCPPERRELLRRTRPLIFSLALRDPVQTERALIQLLLEYGVIDQAQADHLLRTDSNGT